jgi:arginine utilization protein RocB
VYAKDLIKGWQQEKYEMQQIAIMAVRKIYEMSGLNQPMIIISFVPPYYPDCYPKYDDPKVKKLMGCLEKVFETAKNEYGETMAIKDFYGLSDLSYTDLDASMNFDGIFKNVVGNGAMYELPVEDMKRFHIPSSIVMGGYGKDFHKTTERLNMKYNFDVLPYLYIQLITDLLNG